MKYPNGQAFYNQPSRKQTAVLVHFNWVHGHIKMAKIIDERTQIDPTIRIFDSFYSVSLTVGAAQYDIVHGYFTKVCGTERIANNFTAFLFRIAQETNTSVMTLLQQFQGKGSLPEITATMAYFLNSTRSATTLVGLNVPTQPNYYVAHNIRI